MGRPILMVALMVVVIAGIGYASINASKYNEVSNLAGVDVPTRVTVKGEVVSLGNGKSVMVYNGEVYELDARGPYAIAEGPGNSLVVFLLRGETGFMVAAVYPSADFLARYGGSPIIDASIVVDGIYYPGQTIRLTINGETVEVPVLEIYTILKGCHSSYSQEQATVG